MAVISPSQTDAKSPLNVALMDELRARSNSAYQTGDIKWHHSYNGLVDAGAGWMLCDGRVINESNYNTERGSGTAWDDEVGASVLDGKYLPNLIGKYLVGASTTTQTGSSAITSVGNSSHQINISHSHTVGDHVHPWYRHTNVGDDHSFNLSGSEVDLTKVLKSSGEVHVAARDDATDGINAGLTDGYIYTGHNSTTSTNSQLSSTQSIQPESIEAQPYMMIV